MRRQFFSLPAAGILCVFLTAGALAASQPGDTEQAQLAAQLKRRAERLDWRAQGTKGVPRAHLEQQSVRIKNLIKRLEAGEAVDPQEIDQLLRQGPQ